MTPYLSLFLLGVFAAYAYHGTIAARKRSPPVIRLIAEMLAIVFFLIIVLMTPSIYGLLLGREVPLDYFHNTLTPFGILWASFLFCYLSGTGHIARILSWRPLRFLGIISFSLYLWHPPIIHLVAGQVIAHPTFKALLAAALAVLLASFTYVAVERPFLRIRIRA